MLTALHHLPSSCHLVSTKRKLTWWACEHVPVFCVSPRTHQRVIGPSSIAWWVIHLRHFRCMIRMCLHIYQTFKKDIQHSVILLSVSVYSWLNAQVRADWGRVVLCKGEQRLDLRALQRPLLGSRNPFTSSPTLARVLLHIHHHLLLVFSRVISLLAVDLFNRTLPSSPKTSVKVIDYIPICIFKITSWKPKDMTREYLPRLPPSQHWIHFLSFL